MLSSWSGSTEEVMTVLPVALMPQILLGGVVSPLENSLSAFLSYFTFGRWGTEGLGRIQDTGRTSTFMETLRDRLYPDASNSWFDSLSANIFMISALDFILIIAVFFGLRKLLKKH
jgi:hypothetical protein